MRDHQIREQLETIARRGPWGHTVRQQTEDGKVIVNRVSYAAALRHLGQEWRTKAFPMKPRPNKGLSYIQYPHRRRDGTVVGGPRMIVAA